MEYIIIIVSAIFVNNIVLSQFLGICPFLGVSNKLSTATGMSGAVCFVITLATLVTYLLNQYLLVPFGLEFLQTIAFILVIAALVQMVEIVLKKISPSLYQALGIFLPLITTNCAVLGVAITVVTKEFTFGAESHMLNLRSRSRVCRLRSSPSVSSHLPSSVSQVSSSLRFENKDDGLRDSRRPLLYSSVKADMMGVGRPSEPKAPRR